MWHLLFFIGWIGVFILALGGILLGIVPGYISEYVNVFELNTKIIIIGISIFYFILFLKKISDIFDSGEEENYVMKNENGSIRITLSSIENLIKGIVKNADFIKESKIKGKIDKDDVKVVIKAGVNSIPDLNEEVNKLQKEIIEYIDRVAGITIKNVDIIVSKVVNNEVRALVPSKSSSVEVEVEGDDLDEDESFNK